MRPQPPFSQASSLAPLASSPCHPQAPWASLFSSESVGEGHPDKVCHQVSDAVLDACLTGEPESKVACETVTKDNIVMAAGEITTGANIDYETAVRGCVAQIG